jgi:hypothetical protein
MNPNREECMTLTSSRVQESLKRLELYLDQTGWKGYDPYDAMNSPVLRILSMGIPLLRLISTHLLKRLPLNLRPLLLTPKTYNPKGLGLLLSGYANLYRMKPDEIIQQKMEKLVDLIMELISPGYSGACWGYPFPWQSGFSFFPRFTPTIVNTAFVGCALMDAGELLKRQEYKDTARSACDFILNDIIQTESEEEIFFSYTPMDRSRVVNATVLGARLLSRVYRFTGEKILAEKARKAVTFTLNQQRPDGSWVYGGQRVQYWVDNFHTGFVLESLSDYIQFSEDSQPFDALKRGLDFYANHFFLQDGTPKYYQSRIHPIDAHTIQTLITLTKCRWVQNNNDLLDRVADWFITKMQDESGYFYYQIGRLYTNKISYWRWSQAWAFLALTTYLLGYRTNKGDMP